MSNKSSIRQKSVLKTTLRLTLAAAAVSIAGLVVLLLVVFNLTKQEQGNAQTSMIFKEAEVFQDTTRVLRGSMNQCVIGIEVEASGKGNPVRVNSMVFNAGGTSQPIEQNIENARLWFTANDKNFMPIQQLGATLVKVNGNDFEITCNQNLRPGRNYFWLSFDVKPEAAYAPGFIDASCEEIRIGAISYKPLISSPLGKRFTQPNIPYYSMGNFSIGNLNAWNSRRDGSGIAPKQLNASRNTYFVQAGHHMICNNSGSTLQAMVVEKGGELKITAPLKLNTMNVACGGTLQQDVTVNDYYCFNDFSMENGSNYIHNNTGYLPGLNCRFEPRSNQTFFQYGSATFPYHITWGNVIIDATTPLHLDVAHNFSHVAGDFEVRKTGYTDRNTTAHYLYAGTSDTMHVGGDFVVAGGIFSGSSGSAGNQLCIHIAGNLIMKSGEMYDAVKENAAAGLQLKVNGDVLLMGGTLHLDRCKSTRIIFEGEGESRWIQNPTCAVLLGNMEIGMNHQVVIKGERMGDFVAHALCEVKSGGTLCCNQFPVTGPGDFMLGDNATLAMGSPDGICSVGNKGNILTQGRIFNSGANYLYNTGSSPQVTGTFSTRPEAGTVRRLIVDKDQMANVLTLSQDLNISDEVRINKGDLREGKFEMKLPRISEN